MPNDAVEFLSTLRNIFGVCPCCGQLFRLSDCRIFLRQKPRKDWLDKLSKMDGKLDSIEQGIDENEEQMRVAARAKGRRAAQRTIRKLDRIFAPLRLHADDAKVLCHPVDYVVFKGMNSTPERFVTGIALIDREKSDAKGRQLQRTIEKTIEHEHYEWITLRIAADGSMRQE